MRIVSIYGAPGVGKLTVAKALARLTGFKLADNHATIDLALRYFDFRSEAFWQLESRIRDAIMEAAVAGDLSLITTFVAPNERVMARVKLYSEAVERTGGDSLLVKLTCDQEVLEQRLLAQQRVEAGKLTSVSTLRSMMAGPDFALAPLAGTLAVDSTDLSAEDAALSIARHFELPPFQ